MESHDGNQPVLNGQVKAAALAMLRSRHLETEASIQTRLETIRGARVFGATWAEVGEAMGMSRQTAHKRFGPFVD